MSVAQSGPGRGLWSQHRSHPSTSSDTSSDTSYSSASTRAILRLGVCGAVIVCSRRSQTERERESLVRNKLAQRLRCSLQGETGGTFLFDIFSPSRVQREKRGSD